jgi:trk system potassium uptake protein TrkA
MYIIVVGGGKVGFYLAKALLSEGHEVLIIERDKRKVEAISNELGSVVLRGDGCEASTLEEAGANRADVLVAVTGDDEDNLVACQLAKVRFHVGRTIARINNPKNEGIFKMLGIDATVSSTNLIMAHIEQELPARSFVHLLQLRTAGVEIIEATLTASSPVVGKSLKDLSLPSDCSISLILRGGKAVIPSGSTVFEASDEIIAIATPESEKPLRETFLGS